jgi:hypothetical protein
MSLAGLCELPKLGALQVGGPASVRCSSARPRTSAQCVPLAWTGAALL